jgi:hypothetical protein
MTIEVRGSQRREDWQSAGYTQYMLGQQGAAFLMDEDGELELWQSHDSHAGYTVVIEGIGYEFVRTLHYS